MTDEWGVYVYTYYNGNRLTKFTKNGSDYLDYTYDKLGNTTNINGTAYEYDECSRMITAGNVSYKYDANGNLEKTTMPVGETVYGYDKRNRERPFGDERDRLGTYILWYYFAFVITPLEIPAV